LGGKRAWTATAAAGHILMQDPIVMAEAERIPFVMYVGQRGGPSTGTVIYSQQELNLARAGGNGEGMRLVLGPSNLQELYEHMILAFDWAYRYRLPVIVLGDGYLSKMTGPINLTKAGKIAPAKPIFNFEHPVNLRNTYSNEDELYQVLKRELKDYGTICTALEKSESLYCEDAEVVVFAWGTVGSAAKEAVKKLRGEGLSVGLFRPITLKPFGATKAKKAANNAKKILIAESSFGQFGRLVTESLFGLSDIEIERLYRPAKGITPDEIEAKLREMVS
jgi:2-oxoglutarate ferredoxin oxidoreductase subunit alpha